MGMLTPPNFTDLSDAQRWAEEVYRFLTVTLPADYLGGEVSVTEPKAPIPDRFVWGDTSDSAPPVFKVWLSGAWVAMAAAAATPAPIVLGVGGPLVVSDYTMRRYVDSDITITKITASVGDAPVGSNITFDLKKNGTPHTIVGSDIAITDGTNTAEVTVFLSPTLVAGDYLTMNVTGIGSTYSGANLVVQVYSEATI